MASPDLEGGLARLEALITPDLHLKIDPANRAAVVGWGLFFHTVDQINAILHLHTARLCSAVAPNRRTVFEYTLCLVWLADEGDHVVDVLNRSCQGGQRQLANRLHGEDPIDKSLQDAFQVLQDTISTPLPSEPDEYLLKVGHLLDEYGLTRLKTYYQAESRFAHASLTAIQSYVHETAADGIVVSQVSRHGELASCLEFCLTMLFDAMLAYNSLLIDNPWTSVLVQVGTEHNLSTELRTRSRGSG